MTDKANLAVVERGSNKLEAVEDPSSDPLRRGSTHDTAAEMSVLSSMIMSSGNAYDVRDDVRETLTPLNAAAFYHHAHELVYQAICALHEKGNPTDPVAVVDRLRELGDLGLAGGEAYIYHLVGAATSVADGAYSAGIVRDLAMRRRLDSALLRCQQYVGSGEGTIAEVSAHVQQEIDNAVDAAVPDDTTFVVNDLLASVVDDLEAPTEDGLVGLRTGLKELDLATTGLRDGEMAVIAGRPAMGKSNMGINILTANAVEDKVPCLFFSLEMPARDVTLRIISSLPHGKSRLGTPLHRLRSKQLTDHDWERVGKSAIRLSDAPLYIDEAANQTIGEIESKTRRYVKRHDVRLVVVDYLQLVKADRPTGDATRDVAEVSERLRALAKVLGVPVVALAQLNRGNEGRESKIPTMADLRQSGQIEQDAHLILLLHREDYYDKSSPRSGEADLIVAKQRSGPTCTITAGFEGHYSRFVGLGE